MNEMRIVGSFVRQKMDENSISDETMCDAINITLHQLMRFYNGRLLLRYDQIKTVAGMIGYSVIDILNGDEDYYRNHVVDMIGEPLSDESREEILDIIDDYCDLVACCRL